MFSEQVESFFSQNIEQFIVHDCMMFDHSQR